LGENFELAVSLEGIQVDLWQNSGLGCLRVELEIQAETALHYSIKLFV